MDAAFSFYKMKAIVSLSSSSLIAPSGAVVAMVVSWTLRYFLQEEGRRLSEQQFVDCSKRSSGCNGDLMDAAFTFYKLKAIASLSSSSLIAPNGAVAAMAVSWTPRSHSTR